MLPFLGGVQTNKRDHATVCTILICIRQQTIVYVTNLIHNVFVESKIPICSIERNWFETAKQVEQQASERRNLYSSKQQRQQRATSNQYGKHFLSKCWHYNKSPPNTLEPICTKSINEILCRDRSCSGNIGSRKLITLSGNQKKTGFVKMDLYQYCTQLQ